MTSKDKTLEIHPSQNTSISGLAQSICFALEKHEAVHIRAIGKEANYITIKALAGAKKLIGMPLVFTVDWDEAETKEGKRSTLLYKIIQ